MHADKTGLIIYLAQEKVELSIIHQQRNQRDGHACRSDRVGYLFVIVHVRPRPTRGHPCIIVASGLL